MRNTTKTDELVEAIDRLQTMADAACAKIDELHASNAELREAARAMLAALEEHVAAHDKIARDAQFTRCGCFSCDSFRDAIAAAEAAGIAVEA